MAGVRQDERMQRKRDLQEGKQEGTSSRKEGGGEGRCQWRRSTNEKTAYITS